MTTNQNAIARRPVDTLRDFLLKPAAQNWLQKQAAQHIARDAAGLVNIVVQAASQTPLLAQCTPTSILAALIQSAQIGLVPNTRLNHSWLVPFNNRRQVGREWTTVTEAQLIIGYEGLIKLVYDATGAATMARAVYASDEFIYDLSQPMPVRRHVYTEQGKERGRLAYAYCLVTLENGRQIGDVLDERMVEARRAVSKSKDSATGPWKQHTAAMWRKTAVRHTLPLVPKGPAPRLERALEIEAQDDATIAWSGSQIEVPQELAGELDELDARAAESQQQALGAARDSAIDALLAPSPEEVARAEAADRADAEARGRRRS